MFTVDRPAVGELNGLSDGLAYHKAFPSSARLVDWSEPHLRVPRLRLLSDPGLGWWDVSYCHGRLCHTGEQVRVELPFSQLPKSGFRAAIVGYAKSEGLYARGLGVLDNISTLC